MLREGQFLMGALAQSNGPFATSILTAQKAVPYKEKMIGEFRYPGIYKLKCLVPNREEHTRRVVLVFAF